MTAFQELKKKSIGYVIYGLDPKLERVEVKEKGSFASYDDFLDKVPKNDAAFVVVDFEYSKGEGEAKRRKIILISWGPEGIGSKVYILFELPGGELQLICRNTRFAWCKLPLTTLYATCWMVSAPTFKLLTCPTSSTMSLLRDANLLLSYMPNDSTLVEGSEAKPNS